MKKIAFLLLSCDRYYAMIDPFAELMNRFWPDCPWPKFAATNTIPYENHGLKPLLIGADIPWSAGLRCILNQLRDLGFEYAFITLEDLFLRDKVDTAKVMQITDDFIERDGNYIRFYTHRKPSVAVTPDFGELLPGEPYRQNCVYALWNIQVMLEILKDDENAWQFELVAVERGYAYPGFYSTNKSHFKILNTLIKGKWVPYDLKVARRLLPGLAIDRSVMSRFDEFKLNAKRFVNGIAFAILPNSLISRLQKKLRSYH